MRAEPYPDIPALEEDFKRLGLDDERRVHHVFHYHFHTCGHIVSPDLATLLNPDHYRPGQLPTSQPDSFLAMLHDALRRHEEAADSD